MPTVLDRPGIKKRPSEQPPRPPQRPVRPFRWLRWVGWLLAAAAVAVVAVLVVNADTDDSVPPAAVELPTSAPSPQTPMVPVISIDPRLGFGEEATTTPPSHTRLVEHAPGYIQHPETTFMEEATVTPGLTIIGEPVAAESLPPTLLTVGDDPRLGFGEEATTTPPSHTRLVEHAPGYIQHPETTFMEEATVTPGLTNIGEPEPQGGLEFWETF